MTNDNRVYFPAAWMRGGSSKGLFVKAADLPADPTIRDAWLLRAMGSPDPYGTQMDGLGGGTSSTSKVVVVDESAPEGCDLSYHFGAVAVGEQLIDWSGNCGNLTTAVAPFAIREGLIPVPWSEALEHVPVRLWMATQRRVIVARVPVQRGKVVETGEFRLDGVAFPGAEIALTFEDPAGEGSVLPTGRARETLVVAGLGEVEVSLVDAGNPTVFVGAGALGIEGTEPRAQLADNAHFLASCEAIRAVATVAMGLAETPEAATRKRPHAPKLAWVCSSRDYQASDGRQIRTEETDLIVRMVSMGQVHHAITGTGSVATAAAAVIPGTLVNGAVHGERLPGEVRIGHTAGVLCVTAEAEARAGRWCIRAVHLSRTARLLMVGDVPVPDP